MLERLRAFLGSARSAALVDYGDEPLALGTSNYVLEIRSGRLTLEAWDEKRSVSRRIVAIERSRAGMIDCVVQRFGGTTGRLTLLDLDRPQTTHRAAQVHRQSFAQQFRRILQRQYPAWQILALSSELDLQRSFSTKFPRAHLARGLEHVAALGCRDPESEPELIANALLWYDYLRGRLDKPGRLSLHLFLPEQAGTVTVQRLRWLTGRPLHPRLFRFDERGMAGEIDTSDIGNLDTSVNARAAAKRIPEEARHALARISQRSGISCYPEVNGTISVRFRGLQFAQIRETSIVLGIEQTETLGIQEFRRVEAFAQHLSELAPDLGSQTELPRLPEKWFEGAIRANVQTLDVELLSEPVHGQVLSFSGGTRELIDLLAISRARRLAVIELKISEDIQLPIQALDYWMAIRWHTARGELDSLFPGGIATLPPKLLLVAPAFSFHPTNEIVLRYFSPEIPVERIGVNSDWESGLKVVFRLHGADVPISHQERNDT